MERPKLVLDSPAPSGTKPPTSCTGHAGAAAINTAPASVTVADEASDPYNCGWSTKAACGMQAFGVR